MRYSIDTSAILDGWIRHYPPDVIPSLWGKVDDVIQSGELIATEEVLIELKKKDDEVHKWFQQRNQMFIAIDEQVQLAVADILTKYERLVDTTKNRSSCDPFVIAIAQVLKCPVITGEKPSNSPNKPKIPDVCASLDIECLSLLQFIRRKGWVF